MGLVTALIGPVLFSLSPYGQHYQLAAAKTTLTVSATAQPRRTTAHSLPRRVMPLLALSPATPTPAQPPPAPAYDRYLTFDYLPALRAYNELSPGNVGNRSTEEHAAIEFSLFRFHLVALGGFNLFDYPHEQDSPVPVDCASHPNEEGCVEVIGDGGRVFIPAFNVNDYELEAGLGFRIAPDHWYVTADYIYSATNFGDPDLLGGGFGIQKLPDLDRQFSLYGRVNYYPEISNPHILGAIAGHALSYHYLKYEVGATWRLPKSFFANLAYGCDEHYNRSNAPANASLCGPQVGVGVHW